MQKSGTVGLLLILVVLVGLVLLTVNREPFHSNVRTTPTPTPVTYNTTYSLELVPGETITMTVGSSFPVQTLLKNNGRLVSDQKDFSYIWGSSEWATVSMAISDKCVDGMVLPCPYDYAILFGLKPGKADIWVDVFQNTGLGPRDRNPVVKTTWVRVNVVEK